MRFIGNAPVDGEVRAIASGALATGDTVVVNSDGTVSVVGETNINQVVGSPVVFDSDGFAVTSGRGSEMSTFDSSNNKVIIVYTDEGNSSRGTAVVGTVSGTSISFGTPTVFESDSISGTSVTFDSNLNKVVIAYLRGDFGRAIVGTVSGTSISFGSFVNFLSSETFYCGITFDSNANKVVVAYRDGATGYATAVVGTVSGTSISFGSSVVLETISMFAASPTFDSNSKKVVITYNDGTNSDGSSVVFQNTATETNLTSENFVGFANSGYASGQSAALNSTCSVDKNQSGLTAGETYYVQTDGTLGTTPADPSVLAGTAISSNSIIVKG